MSNSKYTRQTVLDIKSWVPGKLLSLRVTRDPHFNFEPGQFARLGLPATPHAQTEPTIWRAYSMVNAPQQTPLEFYSIVVPDGEFSPRLAQLQPGDAIYIDKTPFGFLTLDRFSPGRDLWLIGTGTGLSAYLSLLQDSNTWVSFERIILVHGVRTENELAYRDLITEWVDTAPSFGQADAPRARLSYLPIATQQALPNSPQARLTTLLQDGRLETLAGVSLDPEHARIMLCGNPDMLSDARKLLSQRGFAVGRRGNKGNLALENYW